MISWGDVAAVSAPVVLIPRDVEAPALQAASGIATGLATELVVTADVFLLWAAATEECGRLLEAGPVMTAGRTERAVAGRSAVLEEASL